MADHPTRNPFPARGTSSAEETSRPEFLRDWARHTPTALLPGVRGTMRLAEDYVRSFEDESTRDGGLACLFGAHGMGKTHAARHMMAFLDRENSRAVQLYLRFQEDDFVAAYRRLVSQLPQRLLTDLSLRYLDVLSRDLAKAGDDPDPGRGHRVELGEVLEEQAKEIAAVTGDGLQFQRALSFLLRSEFSDAAYDWLCGRPIDDEDARALGVSGRIDDPLTCRYGVQLLTTVVTRSGRPFVLILDQCEKFLLRHGEPVAGNIGLLQGLVETIPQVNGMLLLVASEAGWECMPPDLRQRIGGGALHMLPLTPDEARLVIGAYVEAARPGRGEGISPFTEAGSHELLRHSGGNVRLLLQLSWMSFEASAPGQDIGADVVAYVSAGHSRAPALADLGMLVEARLLAAGLALERVDGRLFLLPDRRDPHALVMLSEAIFHDGEAVPVEEGLRSAAQSGFKALLVSGYVSPAAVKGLRGTAHTVLVADGSPAFASGLDRLVAQLTTVLAGQERAEPGQNPLDEVLRDLTSRLEELSSHQRAEPGNAAEAVAGPSGNGVSRWTSRREELVTGIAEARAARRAADWAELAKARAEVVHAYRRSRGLLAAALLAGLTAAVIGLAAGVFGAVSTGSAALAAVMVAAVAVSVLAMRKLAALAPARPWVPLATRRDLDQLGREIRAPAALESADPVIRYAGALREDPDEGFQRLADALMAEPLAIVRQAIGQRLALAKATPAECVPQVRRGMQETIPEVLLLLARRQPHAEPSRPPRALRDLPAELRVLVALGNPGCLTLADGAATRSAGETVLETLGVRGARHPLAQAFRSGSGELAPVEIPANELRAAARLLSPQEHNGLGTYDWLPFIAEIDELYLFFSELIHRQETKRAIRREP